LSHSHAAHTPPA
jgi:hypothetical protein